LQYGYRAKSVTAGLGFSLGCMLDLLRNKLVARR